MKKTLLSSAITAVFFSTYLAWTCFTTGRAEGQVAMAPAASAAPGAGGIALVDVNYIFKNHARLKAQLDGLQAEAEKVQTDFEQELQRMQSDAEQLRGFKPGTPEYTQLEEKMVSAKAIIQGKIALKRKEFVQKEAHLYSNAYYEISDEVRLFCQQRGISLVLNFDHEKIKEGGNPDEIARGISKHVVYHANNLDITPDILPRFIGTQPINSANNAMGVVVPTRN